MWIDIALAVASAVLASLLTLGLGWWFFEHRLRPRLERELEVKLAVTLERVKGELGAMIQERVRQGVVDGIASVPTPEGVRGAAEAIAKSGAEIVSWGLSGLLGDKPDEE